MKHLYHLVYLTTNEVNGKIYVGVHSTDKLEDGYLGSGTYLKLAFKKYGKDNFTRQILEVLPSSKEAYQLEKEIVDLDFVKRSDTYNIYPGGCGALSGEMNPRYGTAVSDETKLKISVALQQHFSEYPNPFTGKHHTQETKLILSKYRKGKTYPEIFGEDQAESLIRSRREMAVGESNPFFGKQHTNETKEIIGTKARARGADPYWVRNVYSVETPEGTRYSFITGLDDLSSFTGVPKHYIRNKCKNPEFTYVKQGFLHCNNWNFSKISRKTIIK